MVKILYLPSPTTKPIIPVWHGLWLVLAISTEGKTGDTNQMKPTLQEVVEEVFQMDQFGNSTKEIDDYIRSVGYDPWEVEHELERLVNGEVEYYLEDQLVEELF